MAIIFGTLIGLIPLTILILVFFGVYSAIKKKGHEEDEIESKPQALDVTYYILMFISLVSSIGALIGILFAAIDHKFKDALEISGEYFYNELQSGNDIRISVAVLFVVFPIFVLLSWLQVKRIKEDSARLKLIIRSVYVYSIVLFTSLAIIGNLIYIIYNFLSGEILVRFIPKSLTLLIVAGLVLGYHIYLLKRDYLKETKTSLYLAIFSGLLVLSSVVFGIVETGTPSEIRARKFDDKRLQDLSQIQSLLLQKWQKDGVLPETLSELNNEIAGSVIPVDPKNKTEYEYRVTKQSEVVTGPVDQNNIYPTPMYDDMSVKSVSALSIPTSLSRMGKIARTDAAFEICANFESVRDVSKQTGQNTNNYKNQIEPAGLMMDTNYRLDAGYYGGDYSNPTWDHMAERTCYSRTISIKQYQIYGN